MSDIPATANAADSSAQARAFAAIKAEAPAGTFVMVITTPSGYEHYFRCSRCGMRGGRSRDRAQAEAAMADHNALRCLS